MNTAVILHAPTGTEFTVVRHRYAGDDVICAPEVVRIEGRDPKSRSLLHISRAREDGVGRVAGKWSCIGSIPGDLGIISLGGEWFVGGYHVESVDRA